jgi:phosphoglycolate phosphatase
MATVAAGWGYCGQTEPLSWGADALAESPLHLVNLLPV